MDSAETGSAVPNMPSFINSSKSRATPCMYLSKFHILLSKQFYSLGCYVAKYPTYFIIIPIFVALLAATGVQAIFRITDIEYLYTPSNSRAYYERGITEQHFPVKYSHRFNPSRVTRLGSFANVLVSAKDDQSMFRSDVWNSLMKLDRSIRNITIRFEEIDYNYYDVCAKWQTECIKNPVLELDDMMAALESGEEFVNYPIMLFPLIVPSFYGGAVINETEGVVLSVKSISLSYWFKEGNAKEKKRSQLYEQSILSLLDDDPFENIVISKYTSTSYFDEIDKTALAIVSYVVPTIILMVLVTSICMFSCDWVRCKIQIGLIGLLTVGLATGCSFGLLMYCKVPFIGLNMAAPFLVLGVGLDDMFVLISAWHRTDIRSEVEIRLAQTYSESAVSITITSVTNTLAFLLGSTSPVPSVNIFCVYIGVSILVTYFYFLTFFGGCLALSGFQEKQNRHAITNQVVKSKSEAETLGTFYAILCAGGININDPDNPKDNTPPLLKTFFKEKFSAFLNSPFTKGFVMVIFLLYWSGAIYGCINIKEGMECKDFVLQDSYLVKYYNRVNELYRKFPHRIQIMINEKISYSDPQTKETLLGLHEAFENLTYIAPSIFTESWIRRFYKFLDRKPELRSQITDEASFIQVLREKFLVPESADSLDVLFNENGTQIVASRFIIQTYEISTTVEETEMMTAIRKVAKDAPLDVMAYHPLFLLYDTWYPYLTMVGSKLDQPYGVSVELMKTAASKFNFCYNLTFTRNSDFGVRLNNGSFTGAIGQIQRGEFEFMITPKSFAYELYQAVGVSEIMDVDSHTALYKYPVAEPDVLAFAKPFTVLSWACMLMSTVFIFFCFLILRFLGRKLSPAGIMPKNSDVDQFFKTFVPILFQNLNVENSYERFLLGFWMIGALILGIVYKSNLTATLMAPKLSVPFINFENMVSQTSLPLVYYSHVLLADKLKNAAPQSSFGILYKTAKPINFSSDVTLDKLKKNEFAVLGVTGYFDGELQLGFSKNGGHCEVTRMDDEYFQVYIAFPFKINSIWKEKMNTVNSIGCSCFWS